MATLKGIDVSKHQGVIDWDRVKSSGMADFVLVRAGFGKYATQIDARFRENMKGVQKAGIPYGLYWYSYAESPAAAKLEAAACLEVIKGYDPELPIFYDMEYEPDILAMTNAQRVECCNVFCREIAKATGEKVGVYASMDFLVHKLDVKKLDAGMQIWVAQYVKDSEIGSPGESKYKCEHQVWQYTSKGKVNGISANVDLDFGYVDYTAKPAARWVKTAQGWVYGGYKNRWLKQKGCWYWFNAQGIAVTGWQTVKGVDYYFATADFSKASGGRVKECQCMELAKE